MKVLYADVILPLAVSGSFTYRIPDDLKDTVHRGSRVEVQFGSNKAFAGIISLIHDDKPAHAIKEILSVLDEEPIIDERQLKFWSWIADYYLCTIGEVMSAALPGGLKLSSETILIKSQKFQLDHEHLTDEEFLIAEAIDIQNELTITQVRDILNKKTIFPIIKNLVQKNILETKEELQKKYKARTIDIISLSANYEKNIDEAIRQVEKYDRQVDCLLTWQQLNKKHDYVSKTALQKRSGVSYATIQSLVKKGILTSEEKEISRLGDFQLEDRSLDLPSLNKEQEHALSDILNIYKKKDVVLLHGVTGSGKTRIYIELIKKAIETGKQVLYLLPEISLTTHFIEILRSVFGEAVTTYHSKLGPHHRTEVYLHAANNIRILVGPRSSVFLPFSQLGLVIVDESHDYSYKQQDPAPRYHGRDAAIMLAGMHGAKIILGTATPSMESFFNVQSGKYGYVSLQLRARATQPPEIQILSLNQMPPGEMVGPLSKKLIQKIRKNFEDGKQCLIFRNRRGYAPLLKCGLCGWTAQCIHCDVSLTYHKHSDRMRCHYCGYQVAVLSNCPECGNTKLNLIGTGTEKLEESLQLLIPDAQIDRLDSDSAKGRANLLKILQKFESGETDILIGTQMITKGLDFENVGLVGVVMADSLMYFPDFRSEERAHQTLVQVAGRAGRAEENSQVMIQTYQSQHPIFQSLTWEGQQLFYQRILQERRRYHYPPFYRIALMQAQHKDMEIASNAAAIIARIFHQKGDFEVLGPVPNPVARIRSRYIFNCSVKLRKNEVDRRRFYALCEEIFHELNKEKWSRSVRVDVNMDPY